MTRGELINAPEQVIREARRFRPDLLRPVRGMLPFPW